MWFSRKAEPDVTDCRRVLFGDLPLEEWPSGNDADAYPWSLFVTAREAWRAGDKQSAVAAWDSIAHDSHLEARHNLQAWHFLHLAGVQPSPEESTQLLGVMAEVAVGRGHDLLVAYSDGTARYLNHAGGVAVIDDVTLEDLAEAVQPWLGVGQRLAELIGVWDEASLPPLSPGDTRILVRASRVAPERGVGTLPESEATGREHLSCRRRRECSLWSPRTRRSRHDTTSVQWTLDHCARKGSFSARAGKCLNELLSGRARAGVPPPMRSVERHIWRGAREAPPRS